MTFLAERLEACRALHTTILHQEHIEAVDKIHGQTGTVQRGDVFDPKHAFVYRSLAPAKTYYNLMAVKQLWLLPMNPKT